MKEVFKKKQNEEHEPREERWRDVLIFNLINCFNNQLSPR